MKNQSFTMYSLKMGNKSIFFGVIFVKYFQALSDIISKIQSAVAPDQSTGKRTYYQSTNFNPTASARVKTESALTSNDATKTASKDEKPFDKMNNIVAHLLLNLTRYNICHLIKP